LQVFAAFILFSGYAETLPVIFTVTGCRLTFLWMIRRVVHLYRMYRNVRFVITSFQVFCTFYV